MTQAQGQANWAGNPSLCDQWIASTLRTLAMLVSILADLLKMRPSRVPGECHTDVTPAALPDADRDPNEVALLLPTTVITLITVIAVRRAITTTGIALSKAPTLRTIAQAIVDSKGEYGPTTVRHVQQQQQQQQYCNEQKVLRTPDEVGAPNPLNASFSGQARE